MRNERHRLDAARGALDRHEEGDQDEAQAMLAVTFAESSYPATAGAIYACHPVSLEGTEEEGDTATESTDTDEVIYALNIGAEIPPEGTKVLAFGVGGRWVFSYG